MRWKDGSARRASASDVNRRRLLGGAIIVIALVLLLGRWGASFYTDHQWYAALGALDVWRAKVATTATLTVASFSIAALFALMNLYAVQQSVVSLVLPRRIGNLEIGEEIPRSYLFSIVAALSVAIGIALVFPTSHWPQALLARVGKPFGEIEHALSTDLGFYVYWLPFESAIHAWAVVVLTVVCVVVVLLYALTPSLRWDRGSLYVSSYVRRHFTVLGAVVLVMLAWSYRLGMYRLLGHGSGANELFTSVDSQLLTPMLLLSVFTLCAAFIVAWAGWTGQMRLAFSTVTLVLFFSLVARTIAPLVLRRTIDPRDDLAYYGTRLNYTKRAFAVDNERMHADSLGTRFKSVPDAIPRLAVWDGATLTRSAERLQHVRTFGTGPAWSPSPNGMTARLVERGSESTGDGRDVWAIASFDPTAADAKGQPLHMNSGADDFFIREPVVYDSAPG